MGAAGHGSAGGCVGVALALLPQPAGARDSPGSRARAAGGWGGSLSGRRGESYGAYGDGDSDGNGCNGGFGFSGSPLCLSGAAGRGGSGERGRDGGGSLAASAAGSAGGQLAYEYVGDGRYKARARDERAPHDGGAGEPCGDGDGDGSGHVTLIACAHAEAAPAPSGCAAHSEESAGGRGRWSGGGEEEEDGVGLSGRSHGSLASLDGAASWEADAGLGYADAPTDGLAAPPPSIALPPAALHAERTDGVRLRLRFVVLHACVAERYPAPERGAGGAGSGGEDGWAPQESAALRAASAAATALLVAAVQKALPDHRRNCLWRQLRGAQRPPAGAGAARRGESDGECAPPAAAARPRAGLATRLCARELDELCSLSLPLPLRAVYPALGCLGSTTLQWGALAGLLCSLFRGAAHRWSGADGSEAVLVSSPARPFECALLLREGRAPEPSDGPDAPPAAEGTPRGSAPGAAAASDFVRAEILYNAPAGAAGGGAAGGDLTASWDEAHEAALGQIVDCVCACLARGWCG